MSRWAVMILWISLLATMASAMDYEERSQVEHILWLNIQDRMPTNASLLDGHVSLYDDFMIMNTVIDNTTSENVFDAIFVCVGAYWEHYRAYGEPRRVDIMVNDGRGELLGSETFYGKWVENTNNMSRNETLVYLIDKAASTAKIWF